MSSRAHQALYVEGHRDIESSLASLRSAIGQDETIQELIVLNYHDIEVMGGGFTLSGCLDAGLKAPFFQHSLQRVWKVPSSPASSVASLSASSQAPSPFALAFVKCNPSQTAIIAAKAHAVLDGGSDQPTRWQFERLESPVSSTQNLPVPLIYPAKDSRHSMDLARPESLIPKYVFTSDVLPATSVVKLKLYHKHGQVYALELPIEQWTWKSGQYQISLPSLKASDLADIAPQDEFLWCLEICPPKALNSQNSRSSWARFDLIVEGDS